MKRLLDMPDKYMIILDTNKNKMEKYKSFNDGLTYESFGNNEEVKKCIIIPYKTSVVIGAVTFIVGILIGILIYYISINSLGGGII